MVHFPEIKDALSELEEMRLETQIDLSAKDSLAFLTKSCSVTSAPIKETSEESSSTNNSEDDESSSSSSSDGVAFPHQKPEPRNRRLREKPYPPACLFFLRLFPGNDKCLDCGDYNPSFAYVNAGVLLCSSCSSNSEVNSHNIKALDSNDEWNLRSVLYTLIGGNENMKSFLDTEIGPMQDITGRYATDACIRYCCNLECRVEAWMQKPITEDIFKTNSYWLANYQPPNLILAERALSALCGMTMRSGVQSSLNNQSRRSLFQVTDSVASSSRRSSAGSGLRSIAGIFSPDGRRGTNETFGSTTNTSSSFFIPTVTEEIAICSRLSFPPACYFFLRLLPKNDKCLDCGDLNPQFANIYFGVLICSQCREQHCHIGFRSRIKSLWLDRWTLPDVLFMMEGGNGEFVSYVDNHHIHNSSNTRPSPAVKLTGIGSVFSAMARRGSADATSKERLSQRCMDDPRNKKGSVGNLPYDLAERYNCKMAAQYRLLLSQRVAVVASKHGAFVPESYFQ